MQNSEYLAARESDMQSYHIITYGCQMNKSDSERMAGMLENIGFYSVETWQEANLIVVNTCSIRDKAERRVFGKFHEMNHFRKKHKKAMRFVMSGCMPQHAKKFILQELPFIDFVLGVNNMEDLPNLLMQTGKTEGISLEGQLRKLRIKRRPADVQSFEENLSEQRREPGKRAWVSIQFGCNKVCSFCIVPFTRGREISRKKESIFSEIASLEKKYSEIVLLGQNVNSYGQTIYDEYRFHHLLEDIAVKFPWLKKIDFLTSYPSDVTSELVHTIASYGNITKEIHFPLQHGDDEILRLMERKYTVSEYIEKTQQLRSRIPGVRIGTDLIVGFPGESEQHFKNMLETLDVIRFDFFNTAAYSIRPGTKAARMKNQVDELVKKQRLQILNKHLNKILQEKRQELQVLA